MEAPSNVSALTKISEDNKIVRISQFVIVKIFFSSLSSRNLITNQYFCLPNKRLLSNIIICRMRNRSL